MSERRLGELVRRRWQLLALAIAFLPQPAFAQAGDDPAATVSPTMEEEARRLFKDGNAFFDAGQYEAALAEFEAAYAIWPNPKIVLNMATTLRALGRDAEALQAYVRYSSEGQPNAERKAELDAICQELLSRVATVRLAIDPDVQSVTLDGKQLDAPSSVPLYIQPGKHVLVSLGAGGEQSLSFDIQPGETRELVLPMAASPEPPNRRDSESTPPPAPEPSIARHPLAVWARADIDGLGRGVLGAGGVGYLLGTHWQVAAGALIGRQRGAWAGVERFFGQGTLQPSVGLSTPVFFQGSAQVGVSVDAGARWALGAELFLRGRAAVVHFPSAPDGYSRTVFVPSLGLEWRL